MDEVLRRQGGHVIIPPGWQRPARDGTLVPIEWLCGGRPTPGLWCPRCLLSSVVEQPLVALTRRGAGVVGYVRSCADCGVQHLLSIEEHAAGQDGDPYPSGDDR